MFRFIQVRRSTAWTRGKDARWSYAIKAHVWSREKRMNEEQMDDEKDLNRMGGRKRPDSLRLRRRWLEAMALLKCKCVSPPLFSIYF